MLTVLPLDLRRRVLLIQYEIGTPRCLSAEPRACYRVRTAERGSVDRSATPRPAPAGWVVVWDGGPDTKLKPGHGIPERHEYTKRRLDVWGVQQAGVSAVFPR